MTQQFPELWYTEKYTQHFNSSIRIKEKLFSKKSKFQLIEVFDTYEFGKVLYLNNALMVTERDEFFYHELIVHTAMTACAEAKNVLIIGGGDGGVAREVCKYPVEKVKVIEIDPEVIEVCKKYFPEIAKGFEDKRVEVLNQDGFEYVKNCKETYDVIIIDSSDMVGPPPIGPAEILSSREFMENCKKILSEEGIFVAQSETPIFYFEFIKEYLKRVKSVFPVVKYAVIPAPSYGGIWSLTFASKGNDPSEPKREAPSGLKCYNKELHKAIFSLPNIWRI